MSLIKIGSFLRNKICLAIFALIFVVSCGKKDSKDTDKTKSAARTSTKNSIYAETTADYTWEGEFGEGNEKLWNFEIKFIAEEGEGRTANGKSFKNLPIKSHYGILLENVKLAKGYKPGVKPIKHQKIKIKYEKEEPIFFSRLESFKCQDEQGNIVELDF